SSICFAAPRSSPLAAAALLVLAAAAAWAGVVPARCPRCVALRDRCHVGFRQPVDPGRCLRDRTPAGAVAPLSAIDAQAHDPLSRRAVIRAHDLRGLGQVAGEPELAAGAGGTARAWSADLVQPDL